MDNKDTRGVCGARGEIKTLETEAADLDRLAHDREEHASEKLEDARAREEPALADEKEIERLKEHARHEREGAAHDEQQAEHEKEEARRDREEAERLREEARRERDELVEVEAIVAGKGIKIEAKKDTTLAEIREIALKRSENIAQPPDQWEVKNEAGVVLDVTKTLAHYGLCHDAKLWIDLRAGAAGDMQTVDPEVTRTKFDREIALFNERVSEMRKKGIFLISAVFPKATFLLTTAKTQPPTVAAAVEVDFTDYDLQPLSVTFVDPVTNEPVSLKDQRLQMVRRVGPLIRDFMGNIVQAPMQQITQPDVAKGRWFICLAGIREYHDNPAHSGDPWLLHRASGEGSLSFILDKLWMYGTNEVENLNVTWEPKMAGYKVNLEALPE